MLINPKFTRKSIDITAFGAVPNAPGSTNFYDALMTTISSVKEAGYDAIRLPTGTYYLDGQEPILDRDGLQFVCPDGKATIVQRTWNRFGLGVFASDCRVQNISIENSATRVDIPNGNRANRFYGESPFQRSSAFVNAGSRNLFESTEGSGFVSSYRMLGGEKRIYEASEFASPMTTLTLKLNDARGKDENGDTLPDGYYIGYLFQVWGAANTMPQAVEVTAYDSATNTISWDDPVTVPTSTLWYLLLLGLSDENILYNHKADLSDFGITSVYQRRVIFEGDIVFTRVHMSQGSPPHAMYMRGATDAETPTNRPAVQAIYCPANLHCYDPLTTCVAFKFWDFESAYFGGTIRSVDCFGGLYMRNGEYVRVAGDITVEGSNTTSDRNPPVAVMFEDVAAWDFDKYPHLDVSAEFSQMGPRAHPNVFTAEGFNQRPLRGGRIGRISGTFRGTQTTDGYGVAILAPENGAPNIGTLQVDSIDMVSENTRPLQLVRTYATDEIIIGPDLRFKGQGGAKITIEAGCGDAMIDYDSRNTGGPITVTDNATAVSSAITISSGTYDNATGLLSLVLAAVANFALGREPILSGLTGTGAYASLGGTWPVVASTGTSLVLAAPAGLGAAAITGGTLTRISSVKVRDRATEGNRNLLLNPKFDDWAGYSAAVALVNGVVTTAADNWKAWRAGSSNATVSWQDGFRGALKCLRLQRNSGNTAVHSIFGVQELPTALVRLLEGKEVTLIFDGRAGANFSGGLLRTALYTGTATGAEDITSAGYPTGGAVSANQSVVIGTEGREYNVRHLIPRGATRAAIRFEHHPTGTAGAADYVDITKVGLIAGATARAFASFL